MVGVIQSGRFGSAAFDPTTISGCVLWLDASDTATITSSGGAVSQWDDKSGGTRHVVQTTAGKKPTTGTVTQNGRNVLDFASGRILRKTGTSICAAAFTVFVVCQKTGSNNTFESFPLQLTASSNATPFDWYNANCIPSKGWAAGDVRNFTAHGLRCLTMSDSTNTGFFYIDGTQSTTNTGLDQAWSTTSQAITVGGRDDEVTKFTGNIAEIIVYDVVLSTGDRQTVEVALKAKWGTP